MEYRNVNRILLISLSCIGDVLMTTPVMKTLKDYFSGAHLSVVVGPTTMSVIEKHALVDEAIVCENKTRHKGFSGITKFVRELRANKYDLVVDLRNTAIPYFLRTRYRVTAHKAHLQNRDVRGRHAIDRHLDVLELAGIPVSCRKMVVTVPDETRNEVTEFLKQNGLAGKNLIAVYPGAGSAYKLYPTLLFKEAIARVLDDCDAHFVTVGSEADSPVCDEIASFFPDRFTSVAGKLNLLQLAALLQECGMAISNDSGPMHLAAAVGTPVVAIFGPTDAERYGPRGDIHRIVWHREECNPCKFADCGKGSCIEKIAPEKISAAVKEICPFMK